MPAKSVRKTPHELEQIRREREGRSGFKTGKPPPLPEGTLIFISIVTPEETSLEIYNIASKIINPRQQIRPDSEIALAVAQNPEPGSTVEIGTRGKPERITLIAKIAPILDNQTLT